MECFLAWKCPDAWKNGSQWVRDPENMVDVAKSYIPSQWASAVSSGQHVAKYCHETKLWPNLKNKCITFFFIGAYNLQNQILKEVIEN